MLTRYWDMLTGIWEHRKNQFKDLNGSMNTQLSEYQELLAAIVRVE